MRHLLLIAYFYPPAGGAGVQRALKWARYLPQYGWRCHVVTAPARGARTFARDATMVAEGEDAAHVVRCGGGAGARWPLPRRLSFPDPQLGWSVAAARAGAALCRRLPIEAVVSTSAPLSAHLAAAWIARACRLPWLADFRDAWAADPMGLLRVRPLHRVLERALVRRATRVSTVSAGTARLLATTSPTLDASQVAVLPNGWDPADFPARGQAACAAAPPNSRGPAELSARQRADGAARETWQIRFVGTVYGAIDPVPVQRALARFAAARPEARWQLTWVGQMDRRAAARHARWHARLALGSRDVRWSYLPHRGAVAAMVTADLLLLPLFRGPRAAGVLSGKIYELLAAGPPVLLLADEGEAACLVRRSGAHEVAPPDDVGAIAAALGRLYARRGTGGSRAATPSGARPRRDATPQRVPPAALAPYVRARQAGDLARVLEDMVAHAVGTRSGQGAVPPPSAAREAMR